MNENTDTCKVLSEPRGFTEKRTKGRRKERQREPLESQQGGRDTPIGSVDPGGPSLFFLLTCLWLIKCISISTCLI